MARKRKSDFEQLISLASMMPWWLCFLLAAIAYVVLHAVASQVPETPDGLQALSDNVRAQYVGALTGMGQYVVPILLSVAGLGSLLRRIRARGLPSNFVQTGGDAQALSWRDFEQLVAEIFRRKGYSVTETARGADGGIDLIMVREAERYLVQCKHWKARQVGVRVVRELKGVIAASGAAGGAVATSGEFTSDAVAFARQAGIDLLDGSELRSLAGVAQTATTQPAPECPRCGSEMVERTARRGAHAGTAFWGCKRFPACRGTLAARAKKQEPVELAAE